MVRPSIPVLYFGNFPKYLESKRKIVTVGLNPSDKEFRDEGETYDIGLRFPHAKKLEGRSIVDKSFCEDYLLCLDQYFEIRPYWRWFSSYFPLLNAIGSDYRTNLNMEGCALHTDLCSPLATNPTWSHLSARARSMLLREGPDLWSALVRILRPDVMLVSVGKDLRERILNLFRPEKRFPDFSPGRRRKRVGIYRTPIGGKDCHVAMGINSDRGPFSGLTNKEKQELGSEIETIAF